MNKYPNFYNYEKRECEICGMLLEPNTKLMKLHSKEKYHLLKLMDKLNRKED
jgi:hypothetical protein